MKTVRVYCWKPNKFPWESICKVGEEIAWTTYAKDKNKPWDYFILNRTGKDAPGIVAFGEISSLPYEGETYTGEIGFMVKLKFHAIIDRSDAAPLLSRDELFEIFPESKMRDWAPPSNGQLLDQALSESIIQLFHEDTSFESYPQLSENEKFIKTGVTYREAKQRLGQQLLRQKLISLVGNCELSGIDKLDLLRASHIIPWKENEKIRGDLNNVLLLAVPYDCLFDNGYISFEDNGQICISPRLTEEERNVFSVSNNLTLLFKGRDRKKICEYLRWHRENLFKK